MQLKKASKSDRLKAIILGAFRQTGKEYLSGYDVVKLAHSHGLKISYQQLYRERDKIAVGIKEIDTCRGSGKSKTFKIAYTEYELDSTTVDFDIIQIFNFRHIAITRLAYLASAWVTIDPVKLPFEYGKISLEIKLLRKFLKSSEIKESYELYKTALRDNFKPKYYATKAEKLFK